LGVVSSGVVVEIPSGAPIMGIKSVCGIFGCMTVYNVKNDGKPQSMRCIDQISQIVDGSKATRRGKEICNLVPKRSVVCMFHDGHELYGVISSASNSRQDLSPVFKWKEKGEKSTGRGLTPSLLHFLYGQQDAHCQQSDGRMQCKVLPRICRHEPRKFSSCERAGAEDAATNRECGVCICPRRPDHRGAARRALSTEGHAWRKRRWAPLREAGFASCARLVLINTEMKDWQGATLIADRGAITGVPSSLCGSSSSHTPNALG
jgi:hypothetical protein